MATVTLSATALTQMASALAAKRAAMTLQVAPASASIAREMATTVQELYPGSLGDANKWTIATDVVPGTLASVRVASTNERVLWWEFGTQPHIIQGKNTPTGRLKFIPRGSETPVFPFLVHHPGTPAHDKRFALGAIFRLTSESLWREALTV